MVDKQQIAITQQSTANLETLIRQIVEEVIEEKLKAVYTYIDELESQLPDPDAGKKLKPELKKKLRAELDQPLKKGKSLTQYLSERIINTGRVTVSD